MDPVTLFIIPGFLGGLVVALVIHRLQRSSTPAAVDPLAHEPPPTDVINMARIRVAGVGGLGLAAMALAVAWTVPRIGQSLAIGLVTGALFAVVLIVLRGRRL